MVHHRFYNNKFVLITMILLIFASCSSDEEDLVIEEAQVAVEETTTTTTAPPVEETTTTTTAPPVEEECIPKDNSSYSLDTTKDIQRFLLDNGFEPGPVDGYMGETTMNAIKQFQATVGLVSDGDVGPNTIQAMRAWTGCEDITIQTTTTVPQSTTTTTVPQSTTTTTVPQSTTTTTVPASSGQDVGYQGYVSPTDNQFASYLRSTNEDTSFCSSANYFKDGPNKGSDVGLPNIYNLYPSVPSLSSSSVTTNITSDAEFSFQVTVNGNGDSNYRFYFIEPFTATYKEIIADSISVTSGSTVATFSKVNLTNGYWFYGYADNGTGGIVKAEGVREFLAGSPITQEDTDMGDFERVWLSTPTQKISNAAGVTAGEVLYITYLLDTGYNSRTTTTETIDSSTNTVKLNSGNDLEAGDVIIMHDELMLINSKPTPATLNVQRGYLNTAPAVHNQGSSVKELVSTSESNMVGVNGYAVFKGNSGYKFSVSLGKEGVPSPFQLSSDCPKDVYSLDYIKIFGWREKGKSSVETTDAKSIDSVVSNDSFNFVGGDTSYTSPSIQAASSDGSFLNTGPKSITLNQGEKIEFDFAGISNGSREVTFIELEFDMSPLTSAKNQSSRKIVFTSSGGSYKYVQTLESLSTTTSFAGNTWEKGYRYILKSITISDGVSKIKYSSNGVLENLTTSEESTHDVYYLDQFIFSITD